VNISQGVHLHFSLTLSSVKSTIDVRSDAPLVDVATNALGAVSGRATKFSTCRLMAANFTQLGLLPKWRGAAHSIDGEIRRLASIETKLTR